MGNQMIKNVSASFKGKFYEMMAKLALLYRIMLVSQKYSYFDFLRMKTIGMRMLRKYMGMLGLRREMIKNEVTGDRASMTSDLQDKESEIESAQTHEQEVQGCIHEEV